MANPQDFDRSYEVESLSLDGVVNIGYCTSNPAISGYFAPTGTFLFGTDGAIYKKQGAGDFNWSNIIQAASLPPKLKEAIFIGCALR